MLTILESVVFVGDTESDEPQIKKPTLTYCPLLEWYLLQSDGECGFISSAGSMLARAEVGPAANTDGNFRAAYVNDLGETYRGDAATAVKQLHKGGYAKALGLRAPNAKGLKEDFMHCGGRAQATYSTAATNPYSSKQCDYNSFSTFALARRCWQAWTMLNLEHQRWLAARYSVISPNCSAKLAMQLSAKYGEFAATAYWMSEPGQELEANTPYFELGVFSAHRAWNKAHSRLEM